MATKTEFKHLSISSKFMIWFLLIALVPLVMTTYISYTRSLNVLRKEVNKHLLAVADNKANQIESYLAGQKADVMTLSHMSETVEAVDRFDAAFHKGDGTGSPDYAAVKKDFDPFFKYYQESAGYADIILVNPDGEIIFSAAGGARDAHSLYEIALNSRSAGRTALSELARVFIKTKDTQETETSDFEYDPKTGIVSVFIAAPIFKGPSLTGVVIAEAGNTGLLGIATNYYGLGRTGETIIATKIGDDAVFITPVRFDPEATFKRKVPIVPGRGAGIQQAVQKKSGFGIISNYRGKEVLSVWRYLPTFRLGMAVEMDAGEVFESAKQLRYDLVVVGLGLLILVAVLAISVANSISNPIKELTKVSGVIANGNYSIRARAASRDEIGALAASFNRMTDSLIEAKDNVEEQKKLLEEANRELDSFVYTVSHDLKAPLRGIAAFADLLKQDYGDKFDAVANDYITRISTGTRHMGQLIEDLLTLSRISRIKNPYENVDMNELMRSVTARIEFIVKEHAVDLRIARNLPVVRCDRIKIAEVFLNLLTNAIKFSSKNGKEKPPRVEVGYLERDDAHEFYVKDNGIGIDPKYHKEIFGIFRRLHKQSEYEGTGAGLCIVKKVIDDHRGSIRLESEPGKGAAFFFTIPKSL